MLFLLTLNKGGAVSARSERADSIQVLVEVFLGVFINRLDVEGVSVDLNVASNRKVCQRQWGVILVHIFVYSSVEELSFEDTGVLGWDFVNLDRVIRQEERDDEFTVDILRDTSVKSGGETENLLIIVHDLEDILSGSLRHELVEL